MHGNKYHKYAMSEVEKRNSGGNRGGGKNDAKGAVNVQRRTWDKEYYSKRAEMRERGELDEVEKEERRNDARAREEFKPAEPGAAGPMLSERAFLKTRTESLNLESSVGCIKVTNTSDPKKAGGWWCEVCECMLKDTTNYLDHINGKKHQRNLGFSMRVERSTVDQVKNRLTLHKRKADDAMAIRNGEKKVLTAWEEHSNKLQQAEDAERKRKSQKKEAKKAKKAEEEQAAMETMDPEIMKMMGFGGFSSKNK